MAKPTASSDLAHCRALIRHGSKSFHAASLLLPARVRDPALAVYAFCRIADDAVDLGAEPHAAVARLSDRLDRAVRGVPLDQPVDRALARVIAEQDVPPELLHALLEGLAWDAEGRRYQTLGDLIAYSARVAGAVGAVMACLMGARAPSQLARATDLGVAMQFTNIARDVGEDARSGRIFLPLAWFAEEGLDPDQWLADPVASPPIRRMTARLLREADRLYSRSGAGIARLPAGCRPAIFAARYLYAGIGQQVVRAGHDGVTARAIVPLTAKLMLIGQAFSAAALPRSAWAGAGEDPLPETRFLVDAAAVVQRPPRSFAEQIVWTVELFAEIEQRERMRRGTASP